MRLDSHVVAFAVGIVLTGVAHVLVRRGASQASRWWASYLEVRTMAGYALFGLVTVLNVYALQTIPLRTTTAWVSLTYILTMLLSHWMLGERLTARMVAGGGVIVLGVVVFSL